MLAIGTKRWQVVVMVALESFFISVLSVIVGNAIGMSVIKHFEKAGIDLSSFAQGLEQWQMGHILYPTIGWGSVAGMSLTTFLIAVIFSLYPAFRASRFKPVEAIQKI